MTNAAGTLGSPPPSMRVSMAAKPLSVWPICHTVSLCPAISQVIPAYTANPT